MLLTGDSTKIQEKIWPKKLFISYNYLTLGHHGSRTSTSAELLNSLKNLKQAIVQARYKKYKPSHYSVVYRLKDYKVPLLKTEDWGNILLEL